MRFHFDIRQVLKYILTVSHLVIKSSIGFGISLIKGGLVPGRKSNLLLNLWCTAGGGKNQIAAITVIHYVQPV